MPRQYKRLDRLPCENCGKPAAKPTSRFCSRPCWRAVERPPTEERFQAQVNQTETCWLWTGKLARGYGRIDHDGVSRPAHSYAFEQASGEPIPDGFIVCHVCDVGACVRNDEPGIYTVLNVDYVRYGHLWLGTDTANMADMLRKGRHGRMLHPESCPRGEHHPMARFTERTIREMRAMYANHEATQVELAIIFRTTQATVSKIVRRDSWQHI